MSNKTLYIKESGFFINYANPSIFSTKIYNDRRKNIKIIKIFLSSTDLKKVWKYPAKALEEIEEESGKQFHPEVVKAFKKVFESKIVETEGNVIPFNI